MSERLLWQKCPSFGGRAYALICTKMSGTLIVHQTPSKFAPYEIKLCFKLPLLRASHDFKVVFKNNPPALQNVLFKIILAQNFHMHKVFTNYTDLWFCRQFQIVQFFIHPV
jgi:hypothetical protein